MAARGNGHDPNWPPLPKPGEFMNLHKTPEWLIDGVVQQGRLYSCTSLTSHGKTATWLYNGTMVKAGRKVAGLEVEQGNSLYMAGENPDDLRARMHGMKLALGLRMEDFPIVLPETFPLTHDAIDRMRYAITVRLAMRFSLIIVDTAPAYFPFDDENLNVEAGEYARILRKLTELPGHPAVVALCHPVKNASRDNLLPRGGSAFLNELDANLTLWSDEVGEQTTLHWQGKIRGPSFSPLQYRLRSVPTGFVDSKRRDEMTIIAEPVDDMEALNRAKQNLANEEAVLKAVRDHPDWSMTEIANLIGWGLKDKWRVQRAIKRLEDDKLLQTFRGKRQLTPKGVTFLQNKDL